MVMVKMGRRILFSNWVQRKFVLITALLPLSLLHI